MPSPRSWSTPLMLVVLAALASPTATLAQEAEATASPAAASSPAAAASPAAETRASSLGVELVVQAGDANKHLKGKALKKAIGRIAPDIAANRTASAGDTAADQVIGLVLAAREAQAAGDEAMAQALVGLAKVAYRASWTRAGTDSLAFNDAIRAAVAQDHAGVEGLSLDPPEGLTDVCLQRRAQYVFPTHAPWECYGGDPKARVVRVSSDLVDDSASGTKKLYTGPREGADTALSIDEVAYAKDMYVALKGKQLRKARARVAPALVRSWLDSPGATAAERVVEAVLAARSADESGDAKVARAYLALARMAYRRGWAAEGLTPVELNEAIATLVADRYPDTDGLAVFPPEGSVDICLQAKKRGPDYMVDQAAPWECNAAKGQLLRVPITDIDPSKNGTDELYLGDAQG